MAGGREQPPLGAAALGGASPAPATARAGHGPSGGGHDGRSAPAGPPLRIYPSLLPSRSVFRDARARTRPSQHRAGTFTSPGSSAAPQEAPAASPGHRGGGKDRSRRAQMLPCASWASRPPPLQGTPDGQLAHGGQRGARNRRPRGIRYGNGTPRAGEGSCGGVQGGGDTGVRHGGAPAAGGVTAAPGSSGTFPCSPGGMGML